jgi:hypothetical protein
MPVDLIVFSILVLKCYEHKQVVYGLFALNIFKVDAGSYLVFDSCQKRPVSMNVFELDLGA